MTTSIDFVAEKIMGFERKHCYGTFGGATISASGSESWFWCKWCGNKITNGITEPCPEYPFPEFDIISLMKKLGEVGYSTFIRYDPFREERNFTILVNNTRVCDTNVPFKSLCDYLVKNPPNKRMQATPQAGFFTE